jgi:enoyl-CoA hydratase/carnithine racemase
MPEQPPPGDPKWDEDLRGTYTYFLSVPKPVIGAINGPVAGLGLAIALACDLRFASETAIFTTAFAQRGLIAEWGISWLLTRLVGPSRALDLLYTGRKVEASEAATIGLVNRAVTAQDLLPVARAYVRDLAESSSPRSMSVMKRQVYTDLHGGLARAEALAADYMAESFVSPDFEEGVSSFLAHRPPRFGRLGSVVDSGS